MLMKYIFKSRSWIVLLTIGAVLSLVIATAAVSGCSENKHGGGKIKIAADIVPLADFCKNVGGDLVEVETMVPPGSSPHSYELTTGQMRFLSEANVLVTNGLMLTSWAQDIFSKVDNPNLVTLVAAEAVPSGDLIAATGIYGEGADDNGVNEHGIYDPHIWLDPNLAVYIVESIGDTLIAVDPSNASTYKDNMDHYIGELQDLDRRIEEEVTNFTDKKFVSFHSSLTYFARRYGLTQVAVIEELPGKEPVAGSIAELVDLIKRENIKAIFAEPQFNPQAAEAVAEEAGMKIEVKTIDPLGDPGNQETETYIKMMQHNLAVMGEVLR
jgi:zinc transport system substrate-binding protein